MRLDVFRFQLAQEKGNNVQRVSKADLYVKRRRAKFAREATMEEFGPRRYWSAHDSDGFSDLKPAAIEELRCEALWRR